jgi:hypothetical protein
MPMPAIEIQGLLLDQFGVLHDGRKPYPGAVEAVDQLYAAGKQLLIISNSSRRSGGTISKLAKMGFRAECFAGKYPPCSASSTRKAIQNPTNQLSGIIKVMSKLAAGEISTN